MLGQILSPRWGGDLILNLGRSGSNSKDWTPGATWIKRGIKDFPLNGRPLDEIMSFSEAPKLCLMMVGANDILQSMFPDWIARVKGFVCGYEEEDFERTKNNIISTIMCLQRKGTVTMLAKLSRLSYQGGLLLMGMDRLFFFSPRAQERLQDYTCMVNKRIEEIWDTYPGLVRRGPDIDEVLKKANDAWSGDKLHLNASGYRMLAEAWAEIIREEDIVVRER